MLPTGLPSDEASEHGADAIGRASQRTHLLLACQAEDGYRLEGGITLGALASRDAETGPPISRAKAARAFRDVAQNREASARELVTQLARATG
jgi:hypothetical protein